MSRDLINLLPPERASAFRRAYFIRLSTVALLLVSGVVVIHGIFLLPSYIALESQNRLEQNEYDTVTAQTDNAGAAAVAELAALKSNADYLARLGGVPSASAALRAVLALPRAGVHLTNISYTPPASGAGSATMTLAGIADTREALRAYADTLSNTPGISKVDLPISVYAKETKLPFTVALTGSFTP